MVLNDSRIVLSNSGDVAVGSISKTWLGVIIAGLLRFPAEFTAALAAFDLSPKIFFEPHLRSRVSHRHGADELLRDGIRHGFIIANPFFEMLSQRDFFAIDGEPRTRERT